MTAQQTYQPSRCNYLYFCRVAADGTFQVGPVGWTLAKTGAGVYVVTHSLGTTEYLAVPTLISTDYKDAIWIVDQSANSLTLVTWNNNQPADYNFLLLIASMAQ